MIGVQRAAAESLARVLGGSSLSAVLEDADPARQGWERAAVQDSVYGALRHLGELRACLSQLLHQPLHDSRLEALLLVALYQLAHSRAAPHAVVDHAVKAAEAVGFVRAKGLVNAVLRNFLRDQAAVIAKAHTSVVGRHSYPGWWIAKLREQQPTAWESILCCGNEHPPFTLRVNRRRCAVQDYLQQLKLVGLEARQTGTCAVTLARPMRVSDLPGFTGGWVSVQDAGAQLAAPILDAGEGSYVLDACAAPGGKAAHLLERADIHLVALDCNGSRLHRVRENLARLGLSAEVVEGDASAPEEWWDGRPYDCILADVPCSASGVVRRHPDIKWLRRETDLEGFSRRQADLVDALWQTLVRGGKFLYATCSVFREENQDQAERILSRHRDARRLPVGGLPADGALLPNHDHDGFFYALFQKD